MTDTRKKFIKLLAFVQNAPEYASQDILTFSGFMDDRELAAHIISHARLMSTARQVELVALMRNIRGEG